MKTKPANADHDTTLAKPLAPEDVSPGDYVAVLDQEYQYPAIVWFYEPPMGREQEVIRVRVRPQRDQRATACDRRLPAVRLCETTEGRGANARRACGAFGAA